MVLVGSFSQGAGDTERPLKVGPRSDVSFGRTRVSPRRFPALVGISVFSTGRSEFRVQRYNRLQHPRIDATAERQIQRHVVAEKQANEHSAYEGGTIVRDLPDLRRIPSDG